MARRWLPLGLALLAAGLDVFGSHGLAFHALLIAVPAAAVGSLGALGELLDLRADDRADVTLGDPSLSAGAANLLSLGLGLLCLEALLAVFLEPRPARVRVAASRPRALLDQ